MDVNQATENIGARRLSTVLETVLDEISFEGGSSGPRPVEIDGASVRCFAKSPEITGRFLIPSAVLSPIIPLRRNVINGNPMIV